MTLPASFAKDGFVTPELARRKPGSKFRRLMIGTEGEANTGKTEFILSAPGPGQIICLDRGFDAMFDNPNPPETRGDNFGFQIITAPIATQAQQTVYKEHYVAFREATYKACLNPDSRTVGIDGDSDSWDLQRLAEHGRLTGIFPQTKYSDVYAARRGFYNKLWDSGKIIIATNKVKAEYATEVDAEGRPVKDPKTGEDKRYKTGGMERQGFPDHKYLWQIQLLHLFRPATFNERLRKTIPMQWGIRILECKANSELKGEELWGADCCFRSLVELVYPQVDPREWGF